jgi:hypothetical protein
MEPLSLLLISTEDATFRLTDIVFISINKKMHIGRIFCDLAKVFDYVNHEMLKVKLYFYVIQRISEDWFMSYSTKRRQNAVVKSKFPSPTGVHGNMKDHNSSACVVCKTCVCVYIYIYTHTYVCIAFP